MRATAPTISTFPSSVHPATSSSIVAPRRTPLPTRSLPPRSSPPRRRSTSAAALSISADVAALVAFSALPFLGVQALADSGAGKKLKEDLEEKKPALLKAAAEAERRRRQAAEAEGRFFGPSRGRWLPRAVSDSLGDWARAPHLPGEVAGDCGFDPLGLCCRQRGEQESRASGGRGKGARNRTQQQQQQRQRQRKTRQAPSSIDDGLFDRYFELELLHARWAMLGALGALVPEALSLAGLAAFPEDRWQFVGRARLQGTDLNYLGVPGLVVAGKQGVAIIAGCQVLLMAGPELARATGVAALEPLGVFLGGQDKNYPGGRAFDPLNFARSSAGDEGAREEMRLRVAEAKHGRLAMVAWLGFAAQALVEGEGSRGPLHDLVELF